MQYGDKNHVIQFDRMNCCDYQVIIDFLQVYLVTENPNICMGFLDVNEFQKDWNFTLQMKAIVKKY
jgi:hypothetical protein